MFSLRRWFSFVGAALGLIGQGIVAGATGATEDNGPARPVLAAWRVMSFNVRLASAPDGEDAWDRRAGVFFATIRSFQPDLIGFQEVLASQYDEMLRQLPDYGFSGRARDDGKRQGEWALIGFRMDRFAEVARGDFWLSEHPSVPGSKSWDAALPRICSWVRLRETAIGREFVFANTHFDHKGPIARNEAAELVSRELTRIAAGVPAILTGDLNTTEDEPPYAVLTRPGPSEAISWIDAYREVYPKRLSEERSFHAFKGGTSGSRIDFIFHTAQFKAVAATIDHTCSANGHFPSDHYAVTAVLLAP